VRILLGVVAAAVFVSSVAFGAFAQPVPPGISPLNAPSELYVPLRDAFLATLRANATTDQKFAYASALQKAQQGDILGAQREAAQAMLTAPVLPSPIQQSLQAAVNQRVTIVPMTIAPGPGVPQPVPRDDPGSALAFARSEIDLAELRVGHPVEDARAAYVEATAAMQRNDGTAAIAAAHKASDAALDAYTRGR
jgi:hypothetical protein